MQRWKKGGRSEDDMWGQRIALERKLPGEARLGCCSLAAALLGQGAPVELGPGKSSPFFSISIYLNKQLHEKKRPGG